MGGCERSGNALDHNVESLVICLHIIDYSETPSVKEREVTLVTAQPSKSFEINFLVP